MILSGRGLKRAKGWTGGLKALATTLQPLQFVECLAELAAHSAVPVTLAVAERRFPSAHEAAAFFVCSEGQANVAKYAGATRVDIAVMATNERLVVRVADDGRGGADAARGSGLRGLADRVQALGGTLSIESPPGVGTRLQAELPLPRQASVI